jgi:5,6-dimethylbenzimidazole synthase
VQYEEFLAFVKSRRTIRAIRPEPLPDEQVDKLVEAARWAPTGFNMQPVELVVVRDETLRRGIKEIIDDYKNRDFFVMEAAREAWQGSPWAIATHGRWDCPLAPVMIAVCGDTRRVGLPMAARSCRQKGDSIFESSLSNAFLYLLLAAHSLGLAAQPVSGVKYPSVQCLVKRLLDLPDHLYLYDMLLVGLSAMDGPPAGKLTRPLKEMVHHDRATAAELLDDGELRRQIVQLRAGNVARHVEGDEHNA